MKNGMRCDSRNSRDGGMTFSIQCERKGRREDVKRQTNITKKRVRYKFKWVEENNWLVNERGQMRMTRQVKADRKVKAIKKTGVTTVPCR